MSERPEAARPLCPSGRLVERGRAELFDVRLGGQAARAFALRVDGRPVAYVNRCAHMPAEMDWRPGEFLDREGRWIVCSLHGALYDPASGHCIEGPCSGGRLIPVTVSESEGQVYWYPSQDVQPPASAAA